MIDEVFHERSTWNVVPYKFEAGTMNIAQEVGSARRSTTWRRWE